MAKKVSCTTRSLRRSGSNRLSPAFHSVLAYINTTFTSRLSTIKNSMADPKASLVQVLALASSSDPALLSRANSQLEEWEKDPNFWLVLLQIAFDTELHLPSSSTPSIQDQRESIRILAIIRFKNGIDKFWRSRVMARVTVTIPAETKQAIRNTLFQCLREPNRTIALQAAVAISRVARLDYPRDWPDLFTTLQQAMVQAHAALASLGPPPQFDQPESPETANARLLNTTVLMRAADVCSKTLKELESVRVLAGKMRMTELSRELLPVLHPIFQQYFSEVFSLGSQDDLATLSAWSNTTLRAEQVRTSHLLLKAISRLAVADIGMISQSSTSQGGSSANMAQAFFRSTSWSIISASQAALSNKTGFYITRALQGLAQGGFLPDQILYLSYWYTGKELSTRLSWFYTVLGLSQIIGTLLAAGFLELRGLNGLAGWRYLFGFEGLITGVIGILSFYLLAPAPTNTKGLLRGKNGWFNEREEKILVNRVLRDDPSKGDMNNREGLTPLAVFKALGEKDLWPVYLLGSKYSPCISRSLLH